MVKVVPKVINQQPQVQVCPLVLLLSVDTEGVGVEWCQVFFTCHSASIYEAIWNASIVFLSSKDK